MDASFAGVQRKERPLPLAEVIHVHAAVTRTSKTSFQLGLHQHVAVCVGPGLEDAAARNDTNDDGTSWVSPKRVGPSRIASPQISSLSRKGGCVATATVLLAG